MDDRKYNFKEHHFFCQNLLGGRSFSAFSKVQKSTSKFRNTPETKNMRL